jgi:WD40 repeat protein
VVEVASGRELRRFTTPTSDVGGAECLTFSPDGEFLAAGGFRSQIRLWRLTTGTELRSLDGHRGRIFAVAFSPDSKTLASAGEDQTVRLWDVAQARSQERRKIAASNRAFSVAFSHDGKLLAWGDDDGAAHLVDAATGKEIRQFRDSEGRARTQGFGGLAFAPDDKVLIAVAGWWEGTVRLWDVATGKELRPLAGNRSDGYAFALSSDGKTVAIGGENDTVRLWNVATGKELHADHGYQGRVGPVTWSPDGKLLAIASSDSLIRLHDVTKKQEVGRLPVYARAGLIFTPDSKNLASGMYYRDGLVVLWDVGTGKPLRRFPAPEYPRACAVCLSSDGKFLASCDSQTVFVWEAATGKEVLRLEASHPRALAFTQGGAPTPGPSLLAIADQGNGIRVWDMAARRILWKYPEGSRVHFLQFIDDDRALVSIDFNLRLRVSETATGKELRQFVAPARWLFQSGALSRDGRFVLVGDMKGGVTLGEMLTGKEIRSFAGHNRPVHGVAFAPDGRTVVSGSEDTTALLWDAIGQVEKGTPRELWDRLGSKDAAEAYRALWALVAAAEEAVPVLRQQLGAAPEGKRLAALIADLDDKRFAVREKATFELLQFGDLAEHVLRQALAAKPSLETQRRLERLLRRITDTSESRRLQRLRAVAVLEYIGTPAAREVLRACAGGDAAAPFTRDVRASLQRLASAH